MMIDAVCAPGQQEIDAGGQSRLDGGERKGRMMRLYMRQSLRSTDGTNNRYGNR
jgi:hypothetical protein